MEKERIKIALDFLKDGQSFKVGDLRLGMEGKDDMYVTGWSQYTYIKNISKNIALKELEEIKSIFYLMLESSQELKEFVKNKRIKFNLAYDYGKASFGICYEIEGVIKWEIDI